MEIHNQLLSDVDRYLKTRERIALEDKKDKYEALLRSIRSLHPIDPSTQMLEIGTGTGWFPILCKLNGLTCAGLEISPQLIECAKTIARTHNLEVDIELGNIEECEIGSKRYDVILANFVFEHVQSWRQGLERVYHALRPGGVLMFQSTNKFTLINGEYPKMPFYGALPNRMRYRLRMKVHGPDIMKLGIDFNQFTYPQLRGVFQDIGFSKVLDRVDLADPGTVDGRFRKSVASLCKRSWFAKTAVLTFFDVTTFACIK